MKKYCHPCRRPGCPGVVTDEAFRNGWVHCSKICQSFATTYQTYLEKLERLELAGRETRHIVHEIDILIDIEEKLNELVSSRVNAKTIRSLIRVDDFAEFRRLALGSRGEAA